LLFVGIFATSEKIELGAKIYQSDLTDVERAMGFEAGFRYAPKLEVPQSKRDDAQAVPSNLPWLYSLR
jgi:hypothetical protein